MQEENTPSHPSRLNVYKKFYILFENYIDTSYTTDNKHDILKKSNNICINLEKSVFNASIDKYNGTSKTWNDNFKTQYIITSVKLYRVLNNDVILERILKEHLEKSYTDIVNMSINELQNLCK